MRAGNIARKVSSSINKTHTISLWSHDASSLIRQCRLTRSKQFSLKQEEVKNLFCDISKHKENSRRTRSLSWVVGPPGEDKLFLNSFINISWLRLTCSLRLYLDSEKAGDDSEDDGQGFIVSNGDAGELELEVRLAFLMETWRLTLIAWWPF